MVRAAFLALLTAACDEASTCGTATPDVSPIRETEGIVIARDGTLYFSQLGGVGRMMPDGTIDAGWFRLDTASETVAGLTLDAANRTLFLAASGGIYAIDVEQASPAPTRIVDDVRPTAITLGPDGMLYATNPRESNVVRADPAGGTARPIVTSPLPNAEGLAFEAAGTLLVSTSDGSLVRLELDPDGIETGFRTTLISVLDGPDGLALDAAGQIYVSSRPSSELVRVDTNGLPETLAAVDAPGELAFGTGALRCSDLYVTSGSGPLVRIELDELGARLPWQ
jgi:sugar lactone lactonase YvrE